jgi:eukaryotic-like serine/threonine-protein kinase
MARRTFWKADWFLGLLVALAVLVLKQFGSFEGLERVAYDYGVRASNRTPSDAVSIIAIDDRSIANIGRWPWPRDVHAKLIDSLAAAHVKVIGYSVFFSEPQVDAGLRYIGSLRELYGLMSPEGRQQLHEFGELLDEAENALNTDRRLAESVAHAGNVALPVLFRLGEPRGKPDRELDEFMRKNAVSPPGGSDPLPLPASNLDVPVLQGIGVNAAAIGHLNTPPDIDGAIRSEPLILSYFDQFYPALSLQIAARYRNLSPSDIKATLGERVNLGKVSIRTDAELQMLTYFYKGRDGRAPFALDSFFDVYTGTIPAEKYRDKIVLVGPTAAGVTNANVTPVGSGVSAVELEAHAVSSILQEHFFVVPNWGRVVSLAAFLLVSVYVVLALPRLKAGMGAAATAALLVLLLASHFFAMATQLTWIPLMSVVVLLVLGHLTLTTKRFLVTERGKTRSDLESAESNRMLGLAFQGQGQLDMAFDKFKKCPLDDPLMDTLYNLALDFERKRQFNKAQAVFEYMATHDRKFRDLEQKITRARQMSETVILGSGGGRTNASTMILDGGSVEKPMLGRYQVEKELGKGAMGVVYLGRDPKIGRVVAIKTMALSQEFDADEIEDVKARFFREAETAGRLNHPHIVTIFDAGEEHDLAYIAMEFLKGKDLTGHTKPGALLPMAGAMAIVARVAEALDYAHRQNVVHRDIKPGNIMYHPETDTVKVTDFGIARITDSSKTKTGMVLGTPSFMSPEQLAGRKIDGQSDLFSLGVTLYQLCCGGLPFQGDSMAQLMFKIANEPPIDPLTLNPALPDCLLGILQRSLAKLPAERFKSGEEMAAALRECAAAFGSVVDVTL